MNIYLQNSTPWTMPLAVANIFAVEPFVMRINELANPNANKTAFLTTQSRKMRCRRDLINEAKDSTKATKKEQEKKKKKQKKNGNQDQVPSR